MAEKFRYTLTKEARLLHSSVTQKSVPRGYEGKAEPKFSGTFGIEKEDFDAIVKLEVDAIKSEMGDFNGNADSYYLACTSGEKAAQRVLAKAELDARGQTPDEVFKIKDKAEKRAALYRLFPGILSAASKFDVSLAKLENGAIKDIPDTEVARAQAGKDLFYAGAFVAPALSFQGFKRKAMDGKDGVTCFLQNVLFVRHGEKIGGGGAPNNEVFGSYQGYSPVDPLANAPTGETAGAAPAEGGQPDAVAGGF